MRYWASATDYDGILATDGCVDAATLAALQRYRDAGGQLLMVTGRELSDLQQAFPAVAAFDGVVAENGAIFYHPPTGQVQCLGEPLPEAFVSALVNQQVSPIHRCRVMVATWEPHGQIVQETLETMGLNAQISFNKGAVMVLPTGVNQTTGLQAALAALDLSADTVVGIGDAENDRDLLLHCGLAVAVENVLPALKEIAHHVATQPRGELVDWILGDRYPMLSSV